jgi:hypothetical protein
MYRKILNNGIVKIIVGKANISLSERIEENCSHTSMYTVHSCGSHERRRSERKLDRPDGWEIMRKEEIVIGIGEEYNEIRILLTNSVC